MKSENPLQSCSLDLAGSERGCSNSRESHEEGHTDVSKMLFL